MERIEINTTQNVAIEYDLASFRDRTFAFLLDAAVLALLIILLSYIIGLSSSIGADDYIFYFILLPIFFFFSITQEVLLQGQSIGKIALGLQIIRIDGEEPILENYISRWAFRSIDIYFTAGAVASILINSNDRKQRLGDIVANTVVVKINSYNPVSLSDLLKLDAQTASETKYPGVVQFSESEMLTIKRVLDRAFRYNNSTNKALLRDTAMHIRQRLQLEKVDEKPAAFLKSVLRDYVTLTRS